MKRSLVIAMLAILAIGFISVPDQAAEAASPAVASGDLKASKLTFAYADLTGQRLLGFESSKPKRFVKAVFAPGTTLDTKYVKHQKESDKSNGRQTAWNFDDDEGELYSIAKGKVAPNDSVLLAEKDAFEDHVFLSYKPVSKGTFSKSVITQIEKQKKRKVAKQGLIGQVKPDVSIGLVEYVKAKGQKPLASLVLSTKKGPLLLDFVGNDDPNSTWRVDDGGTITPDMFRILFVTESKQGYSFAYEWSGAEGYSLEVLQQQGGKLRSVLHGSRYAAPI
ncbi:hypothetical protein [Cohnella sp. REN36]|uniref:hypothetical protein n=1 Tax=Cohnella sp. REN36 TaxID=2887347 RepID=UPI001D145B2D|nr:hypothetical protein [Cohnella sp. REN36]MCC3373670.1 hypothetical protein [Cohnella sp. REN36]